MKLSQAEYALLLRQDLYAFTERVFRQLHPSAEFLPNWHIELLAAELEACRAGKTKRLIINLPPRSLKSIAVSVAFVAYWLGHDPSARLICASYGQDLADKHSADCRTVMMSDWYRRLFRTKLSPHKQSLGEFATAAHGFRMATSVGGVVTGRGADVLILDDILKPEDALSESQRKKANDWYSHTLYSRLNSKDEGVIIIVQQRLHEEDLVGYVLPQEDWKLIRFPAIAEANEEHVIETPYGQRRHARPLGEALHPVRESLPALERIRRTIGEYNFAGQYQQSPAPQGGGLVKREWFKTYTQAELPDRFDQVVQSWDTANKATELANYSVCTTWGRKGKKIYLLNVFRRQLNFPDLYRAVLDLQRQFDANVILVEDAASGSQLAQQLLAEGIFIVQLIKPDADKVVRLHAQSILIENGFVWVPGQAAWLDAYLHELTTFPASKHADQVDSTSQALKWMGSRPTVDREVLGRQLQDEIDRLGAEHTARGWEIEDPGIAPWDL